MPKVLFSGSRSDSVVAVAGNVTEITNGWFNSQYSDAGIFYGGGVAFRAVLTDPAAAPLLAPYAVQAGHSVYVHGYYNSQGGPTIQLCDSAGNPWVQVLGSGNSITTLQYNSGTGASPVWTSLGAQFNWPFATNSDFDIKLDLAANGNHTVMVAINRVAVVGPIGFTAAGLTNIGSVLFSGPNNTQGALSEIIATEDWSTVAGHVMTKRPTGPGADTDWTGSYTDVNEVITNDSTVNQSATAGQKQTYPVGTITVPDGYVIGCVFNWMRAKNDGAAPANIQSICRPGATDRVSANLNGMLVTYSGVGARYDVNPDTSAAWTAASFNAGPTQFGFASAT
jgi:hypothetical protein